MPDVLNPIECASRGWVNVALNTLQCSVYIFDFIEENSCKEKLIIKLDPSLSGHSQKACIDQFKSDLSYRHNENCPWYNVCSGEQLTNPLCLSREQLLTEFEQRYNSFSHCHVI